ncbi:2-octaprenyl-3-methyl-6-methoxy-1,4-benzoquinol hydroxylase [Pasteurellaceae bacterium RH1A]|nr:2-octaprenyl-3-methyl-6-methoxy-1,4-benzoquinol hydroxylase [Pasteurellaceae bacterium RH1A]
MQQDVIVVGGGMVGAATALGLANLGLKVALLEKHPLPTFEPGQPYDLRISAISVTSVKLLEKLGAWQAIEAMRASPYDGLETWEIEGFDTAFKAEEIGLDKLGFMVENKLIQIALWQALADFSNCQQAVGFSQLSASFHDGLWQVRADDQIFSAPLVLACDGANSQVRQWAGIGLTSWNYRQHCLLAVVDTEAAQQSVTWQQFYPSGPRAFLPLLGNQACLVWYDSPERINQLKQLTPEALTEQIHSHFPPRLGRIKVQKAGAFPLTRQHAQHYFKNGIVLLGDAAHTINPLAGQGVNLGFKDVAALLEIFEKALNKGEDLHSPEVLKRYEKQRRADNLLMQTGMDVFYKAFKTDLLPVKIARNLGLIVAERVKPLKKWALKYAIGL